MQEPLLVTPYHYAIEDSVVDLVTGGSKSFVASPQPPGKSMLSDMEFQIHNLEQIAYGAVLRAFKAQSDALSWEKEGLITELRKELRVSDDEHRELLTEVNADDLIRSIREWREAGGNRIMVPNVPQHVNSQLPSPSVSASRKRQRITLSGNPFSIPSQSIHQHSGASNIQPLSTSVKRGPPSVAGRRPNAGQTALTPGKPMQYQLADHISSGAPMDELSESVRDPLVGRRVMLRWPADNNFYEALITEYNHVDGRHALLYDSNTPNATLEWVSIKEVPPEDIRWIGEDPVMSRLGGSGVPTSGRGRASSMNPFAHEFRSAHDGVKDDDYEEIEILNTDLLIKKVQKVLDASPPDLIEIGKAKKMLKDHEQTLIEVIKKLANVAAATTSDLEHPSIHRNLTSAEQNVGYHDPSHELQIGENDGSAELPRG